MYPGVVLDHAPHVGDVKGEVRCVLYEVSLTLDEGDWVEGVLGGGWGRQGGLTVIMESLISEWRAAGVQVLLCQKVVHPHLRFLASSSNLLVIDRLALRQTAPIEALLGARAVSSLGSMPPHSTGVCVLEVKWMGGRRRLCLTSPKSTVASLLIGGESEQVVDELLQCAERAMGVLIDSSKEDRDIKVVPGGGGIEAVLASALIRWTYLRDERVKAASERVTANSPHREEWARVVQVERGIHDVCTDFAKIITDLGRQISGNLDPLSSLHEVDEEVVSDESGGVKTWRCLGWDGRPRVSWRQSGAQLMVDDDTVMDSALMKERAIRRAVEMAAVVMRVKGVIRG
jgi:hypothetical protein